MTQTPTSATFTFINELPARNAESVALEVRRTAYHQKRNHNLCSRRKGNDRIIHLDISDEINLTYDYVAKSALQICLDD